jgi:hypothetical protein
MCTSGVCFDPHLTYWKPEFMGPSIEFIVDSYRGKPRPYTVNQGTTPYTPPPEFAPKSASSPAAPKSALVSGDISVPLALKL